MKRFFLIFFVILLSLTLTGCSLQDLLGNKKQKTSSKSSPEEEKKAIAVALNDEDPNKSIILLGIENMAKEGDMEVKVLSAKDVAGGQQAEGGSQSKSKSDTKSKSNGNSKDQKDKSQSTGGKDSESPLKDAKILIYQGGNKEFLQSAQENKVPILALSELPAGVKTTGIILPDPNQAGELMAQTILNKVSEGQVVFLQGDPGDSVAQEELAAFKRVLSKNPKITVHSITNPAGSESIAKQGLMEYLQKNPDTVKAIGAQNEKLAAQASELIKAQQLEKKILLVGGQANTQSLQRMASGTQVADIDTAPYILGVNAFQWAQKVVNKESLDINESITGDQGEVPAKIVPVKSVTPENLAVVQKSYVKAVEAQKQEEAKKQQDAQKQEGDKKQEGQQSSGDKKSDSGGSDQKEGQQQGPSQGGVNIPQGATKVTEKVHTEITREYLDDKGKVIGTEKNSNDQARTIPPEILIKEQQAQQGAQQAKKEGGGDKKEGGGEDEGGEGGKDKKQ
jgi:ABC-type sugar transport system substrate-binding protein